MSTNASISVYDEVNQIYKTIYLHWDGYPEAALATLQEHYNTQADAMKLIELGDLSVLAASPECPAGHSFEMPVDGHCIAYGRDRGEEGCEASAHYSQTQILNEAGRQYNYLFTDGEWKVI